ncbi:MAG: hypothetical protein LBT43_21240 [Prevotella sp.]|nr:hypothetical protein [Prevotella sp.]
MKKTIILFLLIIISLGVKSQCELLYKSLSAFGTDTVAFMTYNFRDRADCYKGKTLKEVAGDLQIPIKDFNSSSIMGQENFGKIRGIYIDIYSSDYVRYLMMSERIFNGLYLEFENLIPDDEYTKRNQQGWTQDLFDHFKDMKIKSIRYTDRIMKPKRTTTKSTRQRKPHKIRK